MQTGWFTMITWIFLIYVLPWIVAGVVIGGMMWIIYPGRKEAARERKGLCSNCGYDLRATLDRCPKCGTIPRNTK
jgi:hypothetical protein